VNSGVNTKETPLEALEEALTVAQVHCMLNIIVGPYHYYRG